VKTDRRKLPNPAQGFAGQNASRFLRGVTKFVNVEHIGAHTVIDPATGRAEPKEK
jgi:hypothetical protein